MIEKSSTRCFIPVASTPRLWALLSIILPRISRSHSITMRLEVFRQVRSLYELRLSYWHKWTIQNVTSCFRFVWSYLFSENWFYTVLEHAQMLRRVALLLWYYWLLITFIVLRTPFGIHYAMNNIVMVYGDLTSNTEHPALHFFANVRELPQYFQRQGIKKIVPLYWSLNFKAV